MNLEEDLRRRAVIAFMILGPLAQPAYRGLNKAFHTQYCTDSAGRALINLGEAGVHAVVTELYNTNTWQRYSAVSAINGKLGFINSPKSLLVKAIPGLAQCVCDADPRIQVLAAEALYHLAEVSPSQIVPAILTNLHMPAIMIKTNTMRILGACKEEAKAAIPLLIPYTENANPAVCKAATRAVNRIDQDAWTRYGKSNSASD